MPRKTCSVFLHAVQRRESVLLSHLMVTKDNLLPFLSIGAAWLSLSAMALARFLTLLLLGCLSTYTRWIHVAMDLRSCVI